ncbi:MAG: 2-C-methyl-D-erythritol 4-phosphate cytidylyltransferase [Firmicutes bacterium]|nr:2-C-methyl-D-erythritol 4-phosphate cytidylyltransferase [Bacillota bacterium]
MTSKPSTAILLAAGKGTRMGSGVRKQYMMLCGQPLLAYSLRTLTDSPLIQDIVMVIPDGEEAYIRRNITALIPGAEQKIRAYVPGGSERYASVYHGIEAITWPCGYVYIHDGARPFLDEETLERLFETVSQEGTAVAGMPSKDTVKITDDTAHVADTPDRRRVWLVQTPQTFDYALIKTAYEKLFSHIDDLKSQGISITDDAMVVEQMLHRRVRLVEASYRNIKVTTPEDLLVAQAFIRDRG